MVQKPSHGYENPKTVHENKMLSDSHLPCQTQKYCSERTLFGIKIHENGAKIQEISPKSHKNSPKC